MRIALVSGLAVFLAACSAKRAPPAAPAAAAEERGAELSYDQAREHVYGMPYSQWKADHQLPATREQMAAFEARQSQKSAK